MVLGPKPHQQLDELLEPVDALSGAQPRPAEDPGVEIAAGADAKQKAAPGDVVERLHVAVQHDRMPEVRRRNERPEPDPLGDQGGGRERRHRAVPR